MIIDDNVRAKVAAIESSTGSDCVALFIDLINTLHTNCQQPAVRQRYKDYATKEFRIGTYPTDADGYAHAFDPLTEEQQIWDCWFNCGVAVSRQVISPELAQIAINRMRDILHQVSEGKFNPDDPTTYENIPKDQTGVPFISRGFVEIYHDDMLAQLRQSIRLYLHYVIIWGRVDLWATFDRMGLKLPEHPESQGLPLHVDQNPLVDPHHHTRVQGVLALVDCKERGTLTVVPGSQGLFPQYAQIVLQRQPEYRGAYVELDLAQPFATILTNGIQVIPIRACDLVSWSSGITHANTTNQATDARKVAYISMLPANEFDQTSTQARSAALADGVSRYDHRAGLHVTKRPRFVEPNTFRQPESLSFLGDLLYGNKSFFDVIRAKANKRLLLNAELFGFGPASAIADFVRKLREHFKYIGFIGSKFSFELQPPLFDAVYIIDDRNSDRTYITNVMQHFDVFFTAMDFEMAEIAYQTGMPVAIFDALAWYWPTLPEFLKDPKVLYLAQDFFKVRQRIAEHKDLYGTPNIVPSIITATTPKPLEERTNVLLNFGGLKNPHWSKEAMLKFAENIYRAIKAFLPAHVNLIIAANSVVAEHLGGTNYSREQMCELLSTVRLAFVTPGLGNIFECANYNTPTIFLPAANDSQAMQAEMIKQHGCFDAMVSWADIGFPIDFTRSQDEIMKDIVVATFATNVIELNRNLLKDRLAVAYTQVSNSSASKLTQLLQLFGTNGVDQVVHAIKSFAYAHRPDLANRTRPVLAFNIPGGQQITIESNMLQITPNDINTFKSHVPGLEEAQLDLTKPQLRLNHIQITTAETTLLQSDNKVELFANYTTKMPADILHLLYGIARRNWLEQLLCPIHAACVELVDGKFVLIVGNSGTGKSSTALKLILNHNARLFSGDKTVLQFRDGQIHAIAGTKIMTLRHADRTKWPQIMDHQGEYVNDRFVFGLLPEQYSTETNVKIDAIFLLQPHGPLKLLSTASAKHTLYSYCLDTARMDVMIGDSLFNGNVSTTAKSHIHSSLNCALNSLPVFELSIDAGDVAIKILNSLKTAASTLPRLPSITSMQPKNKLKFLFGVCGLGSGHTYRQLPIIDALLSDGHEVTIFAYGFALTKFNEYYRHNPAVKIFRVADEFIVGNKSGLDYAASAALELNKTDFAQINFQAMSLYNEKPDCVVSDYEQVSAKVAYRYGAPLITLDQQSKFILMGEPLDEIERLCTFFPEAKQRIALSFFKVQPETYVRKAVTILPPILRPEVMRLKGRAKFSTQTILVYNSSMYPLNMDRLRGILAKFPTTKFIFFPQSEGSSEKHDYLNILGGCHGIICTAGHSLLSEAMYLQIPVFAIPAEVYEQKLNATVIHENRFGVGCREENVSVEIIADFLQHLESYTQNILSDAQKDEDHKVLLGGINPDIVLQAIYANIEPSPDGGARQNPGRKRTYSIAI